MSAKKPKPKKHPGGRPPKGAFTDKTAHLSTRLRADTLAWLRKSATEQERSVSQHVEHLLRDAQRLDHVVDDFGGSRAFAFLQLMALIAYLTDFGGADRKWMTDAFLFRVVRAQWDMLLDRLTPPGDADTPPPMLAINYADGVERAARASVEGLIYQLATAPEYRPMNEPGRIYGEMDRILPKIKRDLGPIIVDRLAADTKTETKTTKKGKSK